MNISNDRIVEHPYDYGIFKGVEFDTFKARVVHLPGFHQQFKLNFA